MEPGEPQADRGARHALNRRSTRGLVSLAGAAALAALSWRCGDSGGPPDADNAVEAAATITAADVGHWLGVLADDSMRGRDTPSIEIEMAASAIARHLYGWGLQPLFQQQWIQYWPIPKTSGDEVAPNTGGWRPGSDPSLADEYVLYVAHMDHVGVRAPVNGDSIYNGADDNASGTSAVLEIAEALGALDAAPRRSVIVLLVSGEEHGLWGSKAFVADPPVPLQSIVAVFNLDMVSRNRSDSLGVAGMDMTTLGDAVAAAAAMHPEEGYRVYDGPGGISDHLPFGGQGIPWLLFFTGLHADYHQPSDEPSRSDPEQAARVARLAFRAGMIVANATERPGPRAP